eukprot:Clim_evm41s225 gene=Clim_evmTU41s225
MKSIRAAYKRRSLNSKRSAVTGSPAEKFKAARYFNVSATGSADELESLEFSSGARGMANMSPVIAHGDITQMNCCPAKDNWNEDRIVFIGNTAPYVQRCDNRNRLSSTASTVSSNDECSEMSTDVIPYRFDVDYMSVVIDGHGGQGCPNFIVHHLQQYLLESIRTVFGLFAHGQEVWSPQSSPTLTVQVLDAMLQRLDNEFLSHARMMGDESGACVLLTALKHRTLVTASVGDCRTTILSWTGKKWKLVTASALHDGTNPIERKRVKATGNSFEGTHVNGVIEPTRTIGDLDMKHRELNGAIIATPECWFFNFEGEGARVILSATDGLYDYVPDEMILAAANQFFSSVIAPGTSAEEATELMRPLMGHFSQHLKELALNRGSTDDITISSTLIYHPDGEQDLV